MIRFKRIKKDALCSLTRRALGKNLSGICTSTTSRGHLHLIPNVISLSLTKWNSRFPGLTCCGRKFRTNAQRAPRDKNFGDARWCEVFGLLALSPRKIDEDENCKLRSKERRKDMYFVRGNYRCA